MFGCLFKNLQSSLTKCFLRKKNIKDLSVLPDTCFWLTGCSTAVFGTGIRPNIRYYIRPDHPVVYPASQIFNTGYRYVVQLPTNTVRYSTVQYSISYRRLTSWMYSALESNRFSSRPRSCNLVMQSYTTLAFLCCGLWTNNYHLSKTWAIIAYGK